MPCKKGILKNFAKFTGKHLCKSLFFNKLYSKRDPGTGVFLWILRNFLEHLFYRTSPGDCFCISFYLRKHPLTTANAAVRRCYSDLKACNFIEKRLQHRCFPVNTAKFLRTAFFIEHLWWLLFQHHWKMAFFNIEIKSLRKSCEGIQFLLNLQVEACKFSMNELFHS